MGKEWEMRCDQLKKEEAYPPVFKVLSDRELEITELMEMCIRDSNCSCFSSRSCTHIQHIFPWLHRNTGSGGHGTWFLKIIKSSLIKLSLIHI